jgi:hypothetical protein
MELLWGQCVELHCVCEQEQRSSGGKCGEERVGVGPEHLDHSVYIGGVQQGTLRYFGKTKFQSGLWCGIQLPSPQGKHDGSVGGVRYFKCPPNHGIFAPASKVTLLPQTQRLSLGAGTKHLFHPKFSFLFMCVCLQRNEGEASSGATEDVQCAMRRWGWPWTGRAFGAEEKEDGPGDTEAQLERSQVQKIHWCKTPKLCSDQHGES